VKINSDLNLSAARTFLAVFLVFSAAFAETTSDSAKAEHNTQLWMAKADSLKLWKAPLWRKLLHMRPHSGGEVSDIDGGLFFLDSNGKTDARAEMKATLRGIAHADHIYRSLSSDTNTNIHTQIRFPARTYYLRTQLGIPDSEIPKVNTERFDRWIRSLNPDHFSVVFASAYMGNPASAMGHTFLRIHSKQNKGGQREILDYGVNYSATTPPNENGFFYSIKGIFGLYPGNFGLLPYYMSLQRYVHIENRDLWHYHLKLPADRQWLMLAHLWEMGSSWSRYYFFSKNCSYFLLGLIDVALPDSTEILDSIPQALVPIETVRALMRLPGVVDSVSYRPATLTRVQAGQHLLQPEERSLLHAILAAPDSASWTKAFQGSSLSQESKAMVVDVALEYALVQKRNVRDSLWVQRQRQLLEARLAIHEPSRPWDSPIDTQQYAPHRVHLPYRAELAGGVANHESFLQLGYRLSYQDLNEYDEGLKHNSGLECMDFNARWFGHDRIRLENLNLLTLSNIATASTIDYPMSLQVGAGLDRPPLDNGSKPLASYGFGEAGYSWDFVGQGRLVAFGMMGGRLRLSDQYRYNSSLQPLIHSGLKLQFSRYVSFLTQAHTAYGVFGQTGWERQVDAELRLGGPNLEFRIAGRNWNGQGEGSIHLQGYF